METPQRSLVALLGSGLIAGLGEGMMVPLIPLALEDRGVSIALIGLYSAVPSLVFLVAGPFLPRLVVSVGALKAYASGLGLSVAAMLLFSIIDDLGAWLLFNALLGLSYGLIWIGADSWLNSVVTDQTRGRIVAFSQTSWGGAAALGPLLLGVVGTAGALPFLVSATLLAASLLPLPLGVGTVPALVENPEEQSFPWTTALLFPAVVAAAFACGFVETTVFALLPLYGQRQGLDEPLSVAMLTVLSVGAAVVQLPLGWLADRFDRWSLQLACGVATIAGVALLPLSLGNLGLLWPLLFLWGGAVAGLYTMASIMAGQRFRGESLASALTALALAYTFGSMVGPVIGGVMLDAFPTYGILVALAAAPAAFVILALSSIGRGERSRA